VAPALHIEQGYLPGNRIAERVRRTSAGGEEHRYRTIKGGTGIARVEVEEEVAPALYEHLWPLTEGRRVFKRRHKVNDGELVWEIDDFADRDLVLAEVELPSEETPVDPPEWLKPYVVREVTGEDEYANSNLAK
jgi:CYTH domain-containing protein